MFRSSKSLQRLGLIYCFVIVSLAIVLVFHAVIAIESESNALRFLDARDIRLVGSYMLLDLELEIWDSMASLLKDPQFIEAAEKAFAGIQGPHSSEAAGQSLSRFKKSYPVASEFFISSEGKSLCTCDPADLAVHTLVSRFVTSDEARRPATGEVEVPPIEFADAALHLFYRQVPDRYPPLRLGVVVSFDHVRTTLLPESMVLPVEPESGPPIGPTEASKDWASDTIGEPLGFSRLFPGRSVVIPASLIAERRDAVHSSIQRRIISGGLSILLACFGLFTIYRLLKTIRETEIRSTFLSSLSHDVRTPISLIRLYADTLTENPDLSDAQKGHSLQVIGAEVQRLEHLINRLLTFSRISRRQFALNASPGDLSSTILQVLDSYGAVLEKNGFKVHVSIADDLPPVRHDPTAISEAVLNLLENSRKYSTEVKVIRVSVFKNGGGVVIEIADRGVGIARSARKRVFEEWFRVSPNHGSGEGLGLFIVKHIVKKHEGQIDLDSMVGVGTTVRITLPAYIG